MSGQIENRTAIMTMVGARFAIAGMLFAIAPRAMRRIMKGFVRMSDSSYRIIGYGLVGASTILFAQISSTRQLAARIDALAGRQPEGEGEGMAAH